MALIVTVFGSRVTHIISFNFELTGVDYMKEFKHLETC
jgi:hypothetical protein